MAVGIRAFSVFVPRYRLPRATIRDAWSPAGVSGKKPAGSRAVAGFDEDALTLATEAALPIGESRRPIHGVLFASTSAPYAEKSMASTLAGVCDVPFATLRATDFGGSARAGTSAVIAGIERLVADGSAANLLVAAAEVRTPPPESEHEGLPGDAAAAIVLGRDELLAEVLAIESVAAEMLDVWRTTDDPFLRSADSKFAQSAGFAPAMKAAVTGALAKAKIGAKDVAAFAIGGPSAAACAALVKSLGADPSALASALENEIGHAGAAQPLLALASALESARAEAVIVLASWGDGADAIVLKATGRAFTPPRPIAAQLGRGADIGGYGRYLKARRLSGVPFDEGPEATNVLFAKEQGQNLRLHGAKCRHCGQVQFPLQQTCVACRKEGTDPIRLSRSGKVFTFTRDNLNVAAEPTTVMSVVDLDAGGRMYLPMTDVEPESVSIGMKVELCFRYYHRGSDFRQYFWKARPA